MKNILQNKNIILLLLGGLLIMTIVITRFIPNQQDTRTRANAGETVKMYIDPAKTEIKKEEMFDSTVVVDPTTVQPITPISMIYLEITYDPQKLTLEYTAPTDFEKVTVNTKAFYKIIEEPAYATAGKITLAVSTGLSPDDAIKTITKVATIHFKAKENTPVDSPTAITISTNSTALSIGENTSNTNVLDRQTLGQGLVIITDNVQDSPTPSPTLPPLTPTMTPPPGQATIPPTLTPTITPPVTPPPPTATPMPTSTPIPTPEPTGTNLSLSLLLHGIGSAGDNVNPQSSLSNKKPLTPERKVSVEIFESNNLILQQSGTVRYDPVSGQFKGKVYIGALETSDEYQVKVKTDQYLKNIYDGVPFISTGGSNILPQIGLVAGDVNSDNKLEILDYNILYDCYETVYQPARNCDPEKYPGRKRQADINDNGDVNQYDLNLYLRELSVQVGR